MTDQSFKKAKTLEDVMDMPMEEHASIMRRYLVELSEKGIGGIFLLSTPEHAVGGIVGIDKGALARFICDMLKDDEIYELTAITMLETKLRKGGVKYDA